MSVRSSSILVVALAVTMVGCGGNGDSNVIVPPPGGGGTSRSRPNIVLGTSATLNTVYLSGASRGSGQIAGIRQVRYQQGTSDIIPSGDQITGNEIRVQLDGYTINNYSYTVNFSNGQSSRFFDQHPMEIARMYEEATDGSIVPLTPANSTAFTPPVPFDVRLRVFPGRVSTLTMRLDDVMLSFSNAQNKAIFNSDLFVSTNYNPIYNAITSTLNDYVSFDISGLSASDRPNITASGNPAERVYYSGDGIAISEGMGSTSNFELLDPVAIRSGHVSTGPLIGPTGQQTQAANVFVLDDTDPSNTKVTSLVGTWKDYSKVILPTDSVSAIAFPSSRETSSTTDIEEQQFVIFKTNGAGNITALWQGQVFYNTSGDPTKGTFRLFPVATIDDAVPSNEVSGTVSNLVLSSDGFVRSGNWDVVSTNGAWPFPALGGFSVFRR